MKQKNQIAKSTRFFSHIIITKEQIDSKNRERKEIEPAKIIDLSTQQTVGMKGTKNEQHKCKTFEEVKKNLYNGELNLL